MIIDAHSHLGTFKEQPLMKSSKEDFIELNRKHNAKFLIMTMDFKPACNYIEENKVVINAVKENPKVFLGCYLIVNPLVNTIQEVESQITKEVKALKIEPAYLSARVPHHTKILPFVQFAAEKNMPVIFHTGFEYPPEELLNFKIYNTKIVMAHFGGNNFLLQVRGTEVAKQMNNVYMETTFAPLYNGVIRRALKAGLEDRIMFGSDYPVHDFTALYNAINSLELNRHHKEKIFHRNVLRILK